MILAVLVWYSLYHTSCSMVLQLWHCSYGTVHWLHYHSYGSIAQYHSAMVRYMSSTVICQCTDNIVHWQMYNVNVHLSMLRIHSSENRNPYVFAIRTVSVPSRHDSDSNGSQRTATPSFERFGRLVLWSTWHPRVASCFHVASSASGSPVHPKVSLITISHAKRRLMMDDWFRTMVNIVMFYVSSWCCICIW